MKTVTFVILKLTEKKSRVQIFYAATTALGRFRYVLVRLG